MTPQVQAVMDRYRRGPSGSGLAKAIRMDAQEKGQLHWHRLYEQCWCGYLTVPAKYYEYKDGVQTNTQKQAETAYLESRTEKDRTDIQRTEKRGRPKKWASEAERLRAYRERIR